MDSNINLRAFFSDTTESFVTPMQPTAYDLVTIRFRTPRDKANRVSVISKTGTFPMEKTEQDELYDYYSAEIQMDNEKFSYHFEAYLDNRLICV